MDNVPSFRKQEVKFRSTASSEQYNQMQDSALYDILNLFNKANKLESDLLDTKDIVFTENQYMQLKIQSLEAKLATMAQLYKDLTTAGNKLMTLNVYPNQMYINSSSSVPAFVDTACMDVTLPFASKTSKVHVYDDVSDTVFIPDSLVAENSIITPTKGIIEITENDIMNAFNGNNSSYWRKKVITDNTVNEVNMQIVIGLPEDIISNREINAVIFSPFPYGSLDLVNIEYKLFGDWTQIPSFSEHSEGTLESYSDVFGNISYKPIIPGVGNIKFCFNDISASELRITVRQRNYTQENGNRVFYLGAREIEIVNYKYNKDVATFYTKVIFPGNPVKVVCDIQSILNNQGEIGKNVVQYEMFTLDDYDRPSKITKGFPFEISNGKMLVKCDIYKNNTSPALNKIKVIYKEKI
jgi:hypothetical protein